MSEQNINTQQSVATFVPANEENSGMQLADILELFLANWKWFVLSVVVALVGATIHLKRSTPIYTRTAQVLIKEEGTKGSFSGNVDWFASLGMGSKAVNVQNEIVAIQSPSMFIEVVKRLGLNTRYTIDGRWHKSNLYGSALPVKVEFMDMDLDKFCSLDMTLHQDGSVVLSHFSGHKEAKGVKMQVGQTARTPLGRIRVTPAAGFARLAGSDDEMLIHVSHSDVLSTAKATAGGLSVALNHKENSILDLTYADSSTERAEDIINTLIESYNDSWVQDKNRMTIATSEFIQERLKVIEAELGNVDNDISSYKSANLIPDPSTIAGMYVSDANTDEKKLIELNNQLYITRYVRAFITKESNKYNLLPTNSGMGGNAGLESQVSEYNRMLLERNRLVTNSSADHPLVVERDQQLAQLRTAMVSNIDNHINLLETLIESTRKSQSKSQAGIASSPQQAKYLLSVERQQKVKEALYVFLLQKREETELSQAFTAYNTRVISPPMGSNAPVSPQGNRILLIAFALGLGIPAALLYLMEITNSRVRGRKDIEQLVVPFIGEIPFVGHRPKKGLKYWMERMHLRSPKQEVEHTRELIIKPHSRNIINEAFRVVRTNLDQMGGETTGRGQVIMVTSANPGSGKTYISANLAASFALKGKKVLMLDFDLRRASASLYVGSPKRGVSSYLNGKENDWRSFVVPVKDNPNFEVLPVGVIPPNPAELLTGARTVELFSQLREEYDVIFVDCPPVEIVADASIIAQYMDKTIFVVRVELMEREMLPVVDNYYKNAKFNNLSLLLNGSLSAYSRYGYHRYGYRYGYGYGYSYGRAYGSGYIHEDEEA
ncbi:MAG: polysaccharide biosynthesis tyrosine autokinase [Bacteroidaceae bacterium]|nr:polysaccharide biosynthesis tyrosine autokinase [Bacteroidaceae bacterium]